MKHKKTPSAPSRRRPFFDVRGSDLADCNEQELQKEGFRAPQPFMRETACASQTPKTKESDSRTEASLPVERAESLPHTNTVPSDLLNLEGEPAEPAKEPEESAHTAFSIPKETKRASSSVLFRIILIGSLLLAIILMTVSLWLCSWFFSDSEKEPAIPSTPPTQSERPNANQTPPKDQATVLNPSQTDNVDALSPSEIYAKSIDSVVSILTESETASGIGSGFLISENGYLATACHVVDGMNTLTVQLADGKQISAKLVAKNDLTDLAVLKIDATNLPFLSFGKSNELLVGDRVFAIGTPASIDYAGSLGSGEVSYLNRTVKIPNESDGSLKKSMTLIQTNVPLNPGNSGCPLLNEYGQVIGIVSMKLGNQYDGIGFAIPSDGALPILQAMVQGETPSDELLWTVSAPAARLGILGQADEENGKLGVRILDFDTEDDVDVPLILQKGDLIVRIDTKEVSTPSQLRQVLQQKKPKQSVRITVLRYGQELTFDVILGK